MSVVDMKLTDGSAKQGKKVLDLLEPKIPSSEPMSAIICQLFSDGYAIAPNHH